MGSASYNPDGEPSPLSSPVGPLSASPDSDPFMRRLSGHTEDSMRYSAETLSSGYDHLSRSSLLDHEHGLGPSGLDRIRQQPSRVFTLPNMSASSLAPMTSRSHSPSPRSTSSTRAHPTRLPSTEEFGTLEDLHRFPCESLHSFSFAQQSEELLNNRHNILKRSIDFMRDRFGWTTSTSSGLTSAQARFGGDADTQSVVDFFSRTTVSGREDRYNYAGLSRGPVTGPADVDSVNIFERAFAEPQLPADQLKETAQEHASLDALRSSGQASDDLPSPLRTDMRPYPRRVSIKKRTFTEAGSIAVQGKLMENLAPYTSTDPLSPTSTSTLGYGFPVPVLHTHSSKWTPASQAVFRTESHEPWTILAANDIACLIFGVTQAELRKLSILEVVQKDRRQWVESKLRDPATDAAVRLQTSPDKARSKAVNLKSMGMGNGVTAQLLSKPPSRSRAPRRAQTDDGYGSSTRQLNHPATKSRGVLLCGDVVPIEKRNGKRGAASIWVMEKRGGLIWVLEEIQENVAFVRCDESWNIADATGDVEKIWGPGAAKPGERITELLPHLPPESLESSIDRGLAKITETKYFATRTSAGICIPSTISKGETSRSLRISSFPHVAGMMVLSSSTLKIVSSNSVFCSALFGHERPEGLHVNDLIPGFDSLLNVLTEEERVPLVDGLVISEPSFRRARTLSILRDGKSNVASVFLEPAGLAAVHRDGSSIAVDVQMRVAKSGTMFPKPREDATSGDQGDEFEAVTELVYALWVSYSRHIHSAAPAASFPSPSSRAESPSSASVSNLPSTTSSTPHPAGTERTSVETHLPTSTLSQQLSEAASQPLTDKPVQPMPEVKPAGAKEAPKKRTISDYVILEEMGQGAYGEVKLARMKKIPTKKMVLKYVTKKRILVDTWTRDRRLGTVPLEIHVLDYLRRDGLKHPNIVEMEGFFEDDVNYYIEMTPHGLPGMDLFDYIELKANMDEAECRNIFKQVVDAIHHLHTKALVVHRDIKDENVILDGEGRIKLIDFGSAAYIKNGPFDVFVGTIDYAAPEVLQGKSYRGKEQDIWALGILLYTIVYKENPFYNVDEILDHPLRVPFLPFSEDCIDLIRRMLDRDVDNRLTISEVLEHPWMIDS
ncbi:serine/threonine protein kinase [Aspergillus sclerotioniger CBS 115572]|uniref:non-specific serine/threonine protein kinase n=1 Tax=Aspergillus sclerotioniger CBS 115572 TaxID=1450535 RepID=A0A317VHH8_9EURO|nr:serine/threonine protein kinase [Aspergillus sclerotioniger CBS 115572]PWY73824.1 serine/threonine protein kinase [Aspergillus sclerotioniger CBS 115572]